MQEKYRHCDETISKLLEWIADVEDKLANQDVLAENIEDLKNQINNVKVLISWTSIVEVNSNVMLFPAHQG